MPDNKKMTIEEIRNFYTQTEYWQEFETLLNKIDKLSSQLEPPVIKPLRGSALLCEKNGWKVGDKLIGNEGYGDTVILLTAIGEENILARELSHNGKSSKADEGHWTLLHREWRKAL